MKKLWILFSSVLYISAFTFGGGYVIVPLMQKKFVEDLKWIDENEMLDLIAIAQSSPGAVAVNTSILIGYRISGVVGSLVAIVGTVIPPLLIIGIVSIFYNQFRDNIFVNSFLNAMRAAVCAVIFNVVIRLVRNVLKEQDVINDLLIIVCLVAAIGFGLNVALIILICALFGLARGLTRSMEVKE